MDGEWGISNYTRGYILITQQTIRGSGVSYGVSVYYLWGVPPGGTLVHDVCKGVS